MRKPAVFVRLLIACAIFLGAFAPKNIALAKDVARQQADTGCFNLDVVFIVDQSWAMSAPGTQEAVDPLNQRKFAVDAMIDLLTGLALDQCPDTHHRIGVISYGTNPRVDLDLTDIAPDTAEEANELRDENGIKKNIIADNLGDSNPLPVFDVASRMLRLAPDIGGTRKKVIIFLTGSIPKDYDAQQVYSHVNSQLRFDSDLLAFENCILDYKERNQTKDLAQDIRDACNKIYPISDSAYCEPTVHRLH